MEDRIEDRIGDSIGFETIKAMHTKFYRDVKNAPNICLWPLKSAEKSEPKKY